MRKQEVKRKSKYIIMILILIMLFIPNLCFAAGKATAQIPFSFQNVNGTVIIEGEEGAPLPEQSIIKDVESGSFILEFGEAGTYKYKIYQQAGQDAAVGYDKTVYLASVSILFDDSGDMYSVVIIAKEGDSRKAQEAVFTNTVNGGEPENPPQDEPQNPPQDEPQNPPQDKPENPPQDKPQTPGQDDTTGASTDFPTQDESSQDTVTEMPDQTNGETAFTGDRNSIALWGILAAFSAAAILVVARRKEEADRHEEK